MKTFFAKLSIKLAANRPSRLNIYFMRKLNKIQLSTEQLKDICAAIQHIAPCKLLVFGLGNDSLFWTCFNRHGDTIFIEDNVDWFIKIKEKSKDIKAFLTKYNTQRKDWERYLEDTSLLNMDLPLEVEKKAWDIILVDAPAGWEDHHPGRMKSIFLASRLIRHSGDIFVHDCNRKVENIFCDKFLGKENLKTEIKAPKGSLRRYKIFKHSTLLS